MQSILFVGANFEQYLRLKATLNNLACIYSVSLPDGIRQFNQQQFSLLILDLSLIASDSGQEELLRSFRRAHPVPIITLCGNTEDSNVVRLLSAGADQVLIDHATDEILAAYARALVNRYTRLNSPEQEQNRRTNLYVGDFEIDLMLRLEHTVEYDHYMRDVPGMAELVTLPIAELLEKRGASVKLEKDIYAKMQGSIKEWEEQAAQTLLLDKALEYVRTPEVEHTSNEWKQQKDGSWEISNLVYKMHYKIWEDDAGPKRGTWLVSWELEMNRPKRPSSEKMYYAGNATVAEQSKKRYDTLDAAQRYIQGRFDLYAPLFTELSPPIPDKFKDIFRINGSLLPGYTLAPPEKMEPDKEKVDALLDCLGDEDLAAPDIPAPNAPAQEEAAPPAATTTAPKSAKSPALFKRKSVRQNSKKTTQKKKKTAPER